MTSSSMGKGDGKFASLTETPGTPVTREGADMMFTRYDYARSLADEKRVLEIACGAGVGLAGSGPGPGHWPGPAPRAHGMCENAWSQLFFPLNISVDPARAAEGG